MKRLINIMAVITILALSLGILSASAAPRNPTEKPGPPKSGFYDFYDASAEFGPGVGNVSNLNCTVSASTQPGDYAGNMLIDCDGEVPHNETTIAVDPNDPSHAVGGYHSYQLQFKGATIIAHIISTVSVTFDGGHSWQEVVPPITPYQFTGDPALAFDANGRLYFANIADHEGQLGNFTGPSVVAAYSDDGGLTWTNPTTVASGHGAVNKYFNGPIVFQDKEFIAVDTSAASSFQNRVYVTWTSFQSFSPGTGVRANRAPIMVSYSDDGRNWSAPKAISGFNSACSVAYFGAANECDQNQFSTPFVAPNGRVYVTFENFNTLAENQVMIVWSDNGGVTWTNPVRIDTINDFGHYPQNISGRDTLTGCQFRLNSMGNVAVDPTDSNTVYVVWDDNRNGLLTATNNDIFLGRSTDGGATWTVYTIDSTVNDQFYPWVAVAPDGRVDVGYMDRSDSAGQGVCQYGFTLTRLTFDSGGTINSLTSTRVDTGLSDPGHSRWFSGATDGNGLFIGDYNGVAVGPDGVTWSLWTDQRNIVANPPSSTRNHGQHAVGARTP